MIKPSSALFTAVKDVLVESNVFFALLTSLSVNASFGA
jgi:hypothetical protein